MKKVVRYLLEGDGSVPKFIENGGYFQIGEELIGISVDEDIRHVPSTVYRLTYQDLIDRVTLINPDLEKAGVATIQEYVDQWLTQIGYSYV